MQIFTLFGEKVIAVHRTDPRTPVTELNIIESYFVDRSRGEIDEDKVREICELFNDKANEIETVRVVGDRTMYRITDQRVLAVTETIPAALTAEQIDAIAAAPYSREYTEAMRSPTISLAQKTAIRSKAGRTWPRFTDSGEPIGLPDDVPDDQKRPYKF